MPKRLLCFLLLIMLFPLTAFAAGNPILKDVSAVSGTVTPDQPLRVQFNASVSGTISAYLYPEDADIVITLASWSVKAGQRTFVWNGSGSYDGRYTLSLTLTDASGAVSDPAELKFTLSGFGAAPDPVEEEVVLAENDQTQYTPNWTSPYYGQDTSVNYWTTPMDITNEEAVWAMLTAPMTVVTTGKQNASRTQITIRKEPDLNSEGVGVVTCVSQGVHVLKTDGDWTLIECYSSSFHDSKVLNWNALVQGWIQTKYIKTVQPKTDYGIVVDKLTQRLYLFVDGHLFSTLLVSTGLANAKQPYNETRSGEFLLVSPVGEFRSDNLYCSYALRFNDGDLLHEVPHTKLSDDGKDFKRNEGKLGTKASHGCIRVQRKRDPNGVNMYWIWDNRVMNTRLVVWEDWQGRQIPVPGDDTLLYYNPGKGAKYHSAETCYSAIGKTFSPFTYGELDSEPFASLERCEYCSPPLRREEIAEINALYALGGDHDPVMTEARNKLNTK